MIYIFVCEPTPPNIDFFCLTLCSIKQTWILASCDLDSIHFTMNFELFYIKTVHKGRCNESTASSKRDNLMWIVTSTFVKDGINERTSFSWKVITPVYRIFSLVTILEYLFVLLVYIFKYFFALDGKNKKINSLNFHLKG